MIKISIWNYDRFSFTERSIILTDLGPIVTGCVCENVSLCVEIATANRLIKLFRCLELGSRVFIPETKSPIGSHSRQSPMNRMKWDSINLEMTIFITHYKHQILSCFTELLRQHGNIQSKVIIKIFDKNYKYNNY